MSVIDDLDTGRQPGSVSNREVDVAIFYLGDPVVETLENIRRLSNRDVAPPVVVLTAIGDDATILAAFRAGALTYLPESTAPEILVEAISHAARGESLLSPKVAATLVKAFARVAGPLSHPSLEKPYFSKRDAAILRELARGANNREIAATLSIAEGTVRNHVSAIFTKLTVRNRTHAALRARAVGII